MVTSQAENLYSAVYVFESLGVCAAFFTWLTYFALPEPKRRMILLPTTSPFFLWNRISEILGDEPGKVAVAGFTPDMLAPAEVDMLTQAIAQEEANARERERGLLDASDFTQPSPLPASLRAELALPH